MLFPIGQLWTAEWNVDNAANAIVNATVGRMVCWRGGGSNSGMQPGAMLMWFSKEIGQR
jgi:hypothetical protein